MDEMKCIAYHEAAHAVAASKFQHLDRVDISSLERLGHTYSQSKEGTTPKENLIVCLSGYAAEIKLYPEFENIAGHYAESDFWKAVEIGSELKNQDPEEWLSWACDFVEKNWCTITGVSEELQRRGCLFAREVKIIVQASESKQQ